MITCISQLACVPWKWTRCCLFRVEWLFQRGGKSACHSAMSLWNLNNSRLLLWQFEIASSGHSAPRPIPFSPVTWLLASSSHPCAFHAACVYKLNSFAASRRLPSSAMRWYPCTSNSTPPRSPSSRMPYPQSSSQVLHFFHLGPHCC